MSLVHRALLLVSLVGLASVPLVGADAPVTVHLRVDTLVDAAPALAECDVQVPAGSNVEAVLVQAEADGCISEWDCVQSNFDCYVTSVNYLHDAVVTFWAFYVDGSFATKGIQGTTVRGGAHYTFTYDQWPVYPSPL